MFCNIPNPPACSLPHNIDDEVLHICDCHYDFFLSKANVVGVALGYKITNNINTFKKCIKVYVTHKYCCNLLCQKDIIPSMYHGIETDVIECGEFHFAALKERIRPVLGGYSISPAGQAGSGTLGCLVKDKNNGLYILSCNHVIARNRLPIGTPILQPGPSDGGVNPNDIIANLANFIPLRNITPTSRIVNTVDCAIAEIIIPNIVSPIIAKIGLPKGINKAKLGEKVKKVGKTTELTTGIIEAVGATAIIPDFQGNIFLFKNQIITTAFVDGGDSGAVLLNENNEVLGLIIGDSNSLGIANEILDVLNVLRVSIVTSL